MKKILTFVIALLMVVSTSIALPLNNAQAGFTSTTLVNSELFNGALGSGVFKYDKADDIAIDSDNIIHFGANAGKVSENAKLSIKGSVGGESSVNDFLDVALKLNLNEIPSGKSFIVAMAMKGQNDNFGQNGLELRFSSGNALTLVFLKSGSENILFTGNLNSSTPDLMIDINNATEGHTVNIKNGNTDFCSVPVTDSLNGYMAFGYSGGKCIVDIVKLTINSYVYERALNPGTITENFDNNEFNANLFSSKSSVGAYTPSYAHVEDGMFVIKDAKAADFTTLYEYSNVELDFQIVYIANYYEDEDGNVVEYSSSDSLSISFGVIDCKESAIQTETSDHSSLRIGGWLYGLNTVDRKGTSDQLIFTPISGGARTDVRLTGDINPMDRNKTDGRRTDVKIIYKDMQFKVYMKYADKGVTEFVDFDASKGETLESVWGAPVLTATTPKQDFGYVRFHTFGADNIVIDNENNTPSPNYAIDNITIKNLDENPALCEMPAFKSNVYNPGDAFIYENTDSAEDLLAGRLGETLVNNDGKVWTILAWVLAPVAVITASVSVVLIIKRRVKNEKKD